VNKAAYRKQAASHETDNKRFRRRFRSALSMCPVSVSLAHTLVEKEMDEAAFREGGVGVVI